MNRTSISFIGSKPSPTRGCTAHAAASRQAFLRGRRPCFAAVDSSAVSVLQRRPSHRPSRRSRRSGQSVLLGAARVPRPPRLGALGQSPCARSQSAAAIDRCTPSVNPAASARKTSFPWKKPARSSMAPSGCSSRCAPGHASDALGRGHDPGARRPRRPRPLRSAEPEPRHAGDQSIGCGVVTVTAPIACA